MMMFRVFLLALLSIWLALPVSAVTIQTHKANYITGYGSEADGSNETEKLLKFQVSFATTVLDLPFADVVGAYTQKSFWAVEEKSGPFKEHNFNPEIFLVREDVGPFDAASVGYEHVSTGEGDALSGGWDRAYLETSLSGDFRGYLWTLTPRLWWVVKNEDTVEGIGDKDHTGLGVDDFGGTISGSVTFPMGAILEGEAGRRYGELTLLVDLIPGLNQYTLYFTGRRGLGDSLLAWDEYTTSGGAGVALVR